MKNKQVLLCGGTGGLGKSVALAAIENGASVTVPYLRNETMKKFRDSLEEKMLDRIRFVSTDLTDETEVKNLADSMPRVDVLIQLAGGFFIGNTVEMSAEKWYDIFGLNMTTTFLACKHSLRRMIETGYGRIVTIGSRAAEEPSGKMAAYIASKAAVIAFTRSIAEEMKDMDITANCVLPGTIDTEANRKAMGTKNVNQWVKPESLAAVICFLGSEAAKDLRGAVIPVYGNG